MPVWQASLSDLEAKDATLVAIAPQTLAVSREFAASAELGFDLLSDEQHEALNAYNIGFELPTGLQESFCSMGLDISEANGTGSWTFTTPSTFIVDANQKIIYSDVEPDYKRRTDPSTVLTHLEN